MNRQSPTQESVPVLESIAVLVAVLFLVLGFLVLWITKVALNIEGDAVFVSLLLAPMFVYMIISGRLKELRVPGGLEAKFVYVAKKPIEATGETIEGSVRDMQEVAKAGLTELERAMQHIDESKPIILTLVMRSPDPYQPDLLQDYLKTVSQYRTFKFVVILDQTNRFVAYLSVWIARRILEMEALRVEFVEAINDGRVRELRRYPGVVTKTISTKTTYIQALQEMTDRSLEALVVIDENDRLRGMVEREHVLSQLMLALSKS